MYNQEYLQYEQFETININGHDVTVSADIR